jgi:Holliday junction resolvasome RuvABC endonuclease subunit
MRCVGFCFQKGKIRLSVLETKHSGPVFVDRKLISIDPELRLPELTDRYLTNFRAIFDQYHPELVAAKIVYDIKTVDMAVSQAMSVGILALACHEATKVLHTYTQQALRSGTPFGLQKSEKPTDHVDSIFGSHPPYWDEAQRVSVVVAWRALLEKTAK